MNFAPLQLAVILRAKRRDRPLLLGYLLESLLAAAQKLAPEFKPEERRTEWKPAILKTPAPAPRPWLPRWMRRDEDAQGLVEYALILALIAIIAIVALLFIGQSISTVLSTIGESLR